MSDTPKFEVIDRRKMKAEEEKESGSTATQTAPAEQPAAAAQSEAARGPRLVVNEPKREPEPEKPVSAAEQPAAEEMPPAPTAEETRQSKAAYDASAQRIEDLVRAQNPT